MSSFNVPHYLGNSLSGFGKEIVDIVLVVLVLVIALRKLSKRIKFISHELFHVFLDLLVFYRFGGL